MDPVQVEAVMRLAPTHTQILYSQLLKHAGQLRMLAALVMTLNPVNPVNWMIFAGALAFTALMVVPRKQNGDPQWDKSVTYAFLPYFVVSMVFHFGLTWSGLDVLPNIL